MSLNRNIGLIDCCILHSSLESNPMFLTEGKQVKKALMADNDITTQILRQNPEVELVFDLNAIINDGSIDLVIISAPKSGDLNMIQKVLNSGKQVQVMQQGSGPDSKN